MSPTPTPDPSHERRVAAEGGSIEIVIRGRSAARAREGFRNALERATARSRRPPVFMRGTLECDRNPSVDEPVRADAVVTWGGSSVRAHAAARTPSEAINLLVRRLRREFRKQRGRQLSKYRRPSRHGTP